LNLTSGPNGQISVVTFCAKIRTQAANKNLLGELGVIGNHMNQEYLDKGFIVVKDLFDQNELQAMGLVLNKFHESWKATNNSFYMEKAVNSAYITGKEHLDEIQRQVIFRLIGSNKVMTIVNSLFSAKPCFMNTQLFFDPVTIGQKNYWHRDPQYHMTLAEQEDALSGPEVVHFRIPMRDERGIELIPGTHRRWDSDEELSVRLETNGKKNYGDLDSGLALELNAGDMLVFSANMIHRGLYGNGRFALDILFCDPDPNIIRFIEDDCLPSNEILSTVSDASAFENAIELKSKCQKIEPTNV